MRIFFPKCLFNLYPLLYKHQSNSERNSLYRNYVLWNKQLRTSKNTFRPSCVNENIIFPLQVY